MLQLWHNDEAQGVAEYAVLLSIVLVLSIMVVAGVGRNAKALLSKTAEKLRIVVGTHR
jgi:Flp pilus assembly pilin Flp